MPGSLFFIISVFLEIKLNRNRYRSNRPIRNADGEYISKLDSPGSPPPRRQDRRGLGMFRRPRGAARGVTNPDMLPAHQQVGDMQTRHVEVAEVPAWGEVSSLHGSDHLYFNDGDSRDEHGGPPVRFTSTTAPRPAADEYNEGDPGDGHYGLDPEDKIHDSDDHGGDLGQMRNHHRENKAARVERLEAM